MRFDAVLCVVVLASVTIVQGENREERIVQISQGPVKGYKEPEKEFFAFYGIPYATAPTGQHRFKAPLPPPSWLNTLEAVDKTTICPQVLAPEFIGTDKIAREDCLLANIYVPDTQKSNLPVVVYVHGGGFQIGYGNFFMAEKFVSNKKFIMATFNYRLGALGFLCLGTEDIPGNAGMKDQIAMLRWVQENIARFGGNPEDVTIYGSSAGASSVDLLMLSPSAKGLFHKVIPDSGANLAAFSVQTDPIANAKEFARKLNFSNVDDIFALEKFYRTISLPMLFTDGFIERKDSTFLFSPCVERKTSGESFFEDSPYNILLSGNYEKVPMLYGFANMEGLIRIHLFDTWKEEMNTKFSDFLPPDLQFKTEDEKEKVSQEVKKFFFGDVISDKNVVAYVDYFSDVFFTYPALRAVKLHVKAGHNQIYLYEYSYVNKDDPSNSSVVPHTENKSGANHCGQSVAVFDGFGILQKDEDNFSEEYKKVKTLMRQLWTNFITKGSPVPVNSPLPEWPPTGEDCSPYMSLGRTPELRSEALLERRVRFWDSIYERHYRAPTPPPAPTAKHTEL